MPSELAVERFLELVQRSGILPEEEVQLFLEKLQQRPESLDSSTSIAEEMVACEALTRWQADQLLRGKHRGFFLGSYRILSLLGEGGMGTVYLAEHQMMHRRCAIKVLPSKYLKEDQSIVDRFYREAQAVAALDHPNIVRAYDVNKTKLDETEIHYLVMEFVGGEDLQRLVERHGVLEYRQAADYTRQAAEGLDHAHEKGFVHRDIKPANLLVDTEGVVKILDLGLAKYFGEDRDATLTDPHGSNVLGTADYLAPEQAINSHTVDARADLYALGQTCYYLLTGRPPFPDGTVAARLLAHQTKKPEPISSSRPDMPPDLTAIIDKMTAKKPEVRYQSAKEVAEALAQWLKEEDGTKFSRYSAMLRGSQPSTQPARREPTRASSAPTEETEIELAPLDEEEAKSPGSGTKIESSKSEAAKQDSKTSISKGQKTPLPPKRAAGDSRRDVTGQKPKTDSRGNLLKELDELPPPQADLMAHIEEAAASSTSSVDNLPPVQAGQPVAPGLPIRKKGQKRGPMASLFESPLLWIGLAVLIVVILISALLYSRSSRREPPPVAARPVAQTPSEKPATETLPEPITPVEPEQPPEEPPAEVPPAEPPAETRPPQEDVPAEPTPETVTPEATDPTPEPPPDPPPAEVAPPPQIDTKAAKALFGGIKKLTWHLDSFDKNRKSKLKEVVSQSVQRALKRARLDLAEDDSTVMRVTLSSVEVEGLLEITMAAEVQCRMPDSTMATVWKHDPFVLGRVLPQVLEREEQLRSEIRSKLTAFASKFAKDYRMASE